MITNLQTAIAHLGAVEVAPERVAVKHGDRWYLAPASDLVEYAEVGHRSRAFIAATWKPLPTWWTPDRRETWSCSKCGSVRDVQAHGDDFGCSSFRRVVADLTTGEEVSA